VSGMLPASASARGEPGVPRFLRLALAATLVAAIWVLVRPAAGPSPASGGPGTAGDGTTASGGTLFLREGCGACHVTVGPSSALGPSLAGVLANAGRRIADPSYAGFARTPIDYVREATLDHCVDLLPGYDYECTEVGDVGLRLNEADVARLVDFLARLPESRTP
jgi:hypothetical protein